MQLLIDSRGEVTCLYEESIDLSALGPLTIRRASHVEPDTEGCWWADLAPVDGPRLGPFDRRSVALDAERAWLEAHWLPGPGCWRNGARRSRSARARRRPSCSNCSQHGRTSRPSK